MSRRIDTTYSNIYLLTSTTITTLTIYTEAITHFILCTEAAFTVIENNNKATLWDRAFDIVTRTIATGIASLKSGPMHRGAVRSIVSKVHGIPLRVSYIAD
jgi:hypothetical protein